jgi:hypothetical protein
MIKLKSIVDKIKSSSEKEKFKKEFEKYYGFNRLDQALLMIYKLSDSDRKALKDRAQSSGKLGDNFPKPPDTKGINITNVDWAMARQYMEEHPGIFGKFRAKMNEVDENEKMFTDKNIEKALGDIGDLPGYAHRRLMDRARKSGKLSVYEPHNVFGKKFSDLDLGLAKQYIRENPGLFVKNSKVS